MKYKGDFEDDFYESRSFFFVICLSENCSNIKLINMYIFHVHSVVKDLLLFFRNWIFFTAEIFMDTYIHYSLFSSPSTDNLVYGM